MTEEALAAAFIVMRGVDKGGRSGVAGAVRTTDGRTCSS